MLSALIKKTAIVIFLFFWCAFPFAQTHTIDSIKQLLNKQHTPKQEADLLSALLKENESLDAPVIWAYSNRLYALGTLLKDEKWQWRAIFFKAIYYEKGAQLQDAAALCDSAIEKLKKSPLQKEFYPMFANSQSFVLTKQNKFKEALSLNFNILQYAEEIRDTLYQMRIKNGVGLIYMEMGQNRDAIKWLLNALRTSNNPEYLQKAIPVYSNLAANYNTLHQNDSATYYIRKSLALAAAAQNFSYLANAYFILSGIYVDEKKFTPAEQAMLKGLSYRKQIGDPFFIVSDLTEIGVFYAQSGQPEKGIQVCLSGIDTAKKYKLEEKLPILYEALAQNYKAQKDYPKYAGTLQQMITLKDSLYKKNSAEALAELQTKYDVQKKETIITQQQLDLVKRNYQLYALLLFIVFAGLMMYIIFTNYRHKQKLRTENLLAEEKRITERAIAEAEESERRRISRDLHDNLGSYATAIATNVDEIFYNGRQVSEPLLQNLKDNVSEIMMNLRDTIWVLNKEAITITAISDKLKTYIQKIQPAYKNIYIEIEEHITHNYSLRPAGALNLFRIMQEALHNALKHSRGTQVMVSICSPVLKISIEDNGTGINKKENIQGNGLANMKQRATESGWILHIEPVFPHGTKVVMTIQPNAN